MKAERVMPFSSRSGRGEPHRRRWAPSLLAIYTELGWQSLWGSITGAKPDDLQRRALGPVGWPELCRLP